MALHAAKVKEIRRCIEQVGIQRTQRGTTAIEAAVKRVSEIKAEKLKDDDRILLAMSLTQESRADVVNGLPDTLLLAWYTQQLAVLKLPKSPSPP